LIREKELVHDDIENTIKRITNILKEYIKCYVNVFLLIII